MSLAKFTMYHSEVILSSWIILKSFAGATQVTFMMRNLETTRSSSRTTNKRLRSSMHGRKSMCICWKIVPFSLIFGRRSMSVSSSTSRQTTPAPPQPHYDDVSEDIFYGANPYDAHGPYDDGYRIAGPSRPAPIPYDDPYADEVPVNNVKYEGDLINPSEISAEARPASREPEKSFGDSRGRGRGRGRGYDRSGGARDRGRGRGRGRPDRGRRSGGESRWFQQSHTAPSMEHYNQNTPHPPSPASDATQRATAQPSVGIPGYSPSQPFSPSPTWPYQPSGFQDHSFGQQEVVQPHINPRFASAFGFNMSPTNPPPAWFGSQQTQFNPYQAPQPSQTWTNQWLVHGQESDNTESDTYIPM